ncbi:MAG TPA: hypothetical protein VJU78_11190 [Chitinophagaceae bacterium]|nr:hypothetical protein [Chitinophagaceae bacterium]
MQCKENGKGGNWDAVRSIKLSYKLELAFDGQLVSIADSPIIYYYKNRVLYQINHPYNNSYVKFDTSGNIISEQLIKEGVRFSYFIYEKDSVYGLSYDSIDAPNCQRYLVDSFLRTKFSAQEVMFDNTDDSLVLLNTDTINYDLFEKYIPKIKPDETYPDSGYYYYSDKLKGINYSFSKKIDSLKKMKLCKVKFIYNPIPKGSNPFETPRREFQFEIKEIPVANPKEILAFFERHLKKSIQN